MCSGFALLVGTPSHEASLGKRVVWFPDRQIQADGRELVIHSAMPEEKDQTIKLPPYAAWTSWRPDGIYALVGVPPADNAPAHLEVLRRVEGSTTWGPYAVLPKELNGVRAALPTADGRLFLIPSGAFLQIPGADKNDMRAWAPFLLMGRDIQGKWTKFETVDLGWGLPFQVPRGKDGKPDWTKRTRRYAFLESGRIETPEIQDRLFELEEGWALVDRHHGMVWVFDAKGAVKRHIPLYEAFKDEDLDQPVTAFPTAVLACESAPEEKLILALRNDTAFFFSRKVWPTAFDPQNPELASSYLLRQAQAAKDFPDITWKVVDTQTGEVRTIPAPKGQPSKYTFRPEDPNWHFHFQVGADGQVVEPVPAAPSK
jgi:hypothetical protein